MRQPSPSVFSFKPAFQLWLNCPFNGCHLPQCTLFQLLPRNGTPKEIDTVGTLAFFQRVQVQAKHWEVMAERSPALLLLLFFSFLFRWDRSPGGNQEGSDGYTVTGDTVTLPLILLLLLLAVRQSGSPVSLPSSSHMKERYCCVAPEQEADTGLPFYFFFLRILEHPDTASHPPTTPKVLKGLSPLLALKNKRRVHSSG